MNIHEGARRIRVIAMCLIALGIITVVIDIVAIQMRGPSSGLLNWAYLLVPGFALALVAWVVDGFGKPDTNDSPEKLVKLR